MNTSLIHLYYIATWQYSFPVFPGYVFIISIVCNRIMKSNNLMFILRFTRLYLKTKFAERDRLNSKKILRFAGHFTVFTIADLWILRFTNNLKTVSCPKSCCLYRCHKPFGISVKIQLLKVSFYFHLLHSLLIFGLLEKDQK